MIWSYIISCKQPLHFTLAPEASFIHLILLHLLHAMCLDSTLDDSTVRSSEYPSFQWLILFVPIWCMELNIKFVPTVTAVILQLAQFIHCS
jgi:hypothetical protein